MKSFFKQCYHSITKPFSGYFSQLLGSLILLFIFRPYDYGHFYMATWQVFLIVVFISAIFNCSHSRSVKIAASCFGLPAIVAQWINLLHPHKLIALIFVFCTIVFIFIITFSIIKRVLINARVKMETLRGVVCAYFMVAFGFAYIYFFIWLLDSSTFFFSNFDIAGATHNRCLSELMYFSFVTLLTIGYGDVIAIHNLGQTFAILEGIIGQFYIAILVSRLVAVYSFFEHKLHLASHKKK